MQSSAKTDLIIIGGGILGVFHAYHAIKAGKSVRLFEKNNRPQGATVRNFGQVVPSGMNIKWQLFGRQSLNIYHAIQSETNLTVRQQGSTYFASNEEEMTLLEELAEINRANDYPSILLTKGECLKTHPNLKEDYVYGGLFFPDEISLDAPHMIHKVLDLLVQENKFKYHPNTLIKEVTNNGIHCSTIDSLGKEYFSEKVIVCNGSDFQLLFPAFFLNSDLEISKLQMLRLAPQAHSKITGNILTGLTIRRYESFQECPSWNKIKMTEGEDSLWKKWGVHILFKQALDATVVIGDSHEYANVHEIDTVDFKLKGAINHYMLEEAKKIMRLDSWEVDSSWAGFYSQCKKRDIFNETIEENIHIVTGIGGKGMTASPGYAKANIENIFSFSTQNHF